MNGKKKKSIFYAVAVCVQDENKAINPLTRLFNIHRASPSKSDTRCWGKNTEDAEKLEISA